MQRNRSSIMTGAVLMLMFSSPFLSRGACVPKNLATPAPKDPVARVLALQNTCPKTAIEFGDMVKRVGARLEPTMVNFTGFHNPARCARRNRNIHINHRVVR